MTVKLYDRLFETTATTGLGAVTLAGPVSGYRAFSTAGNGKKVFYEINDGDSSGLVTKWEVGVGTVNTGSSTLSRDTIISSSNSGAAVNFGAGTKNVFGIVPGSALLTRDEGLNFTDLMGAGGGTANAQTVTMPVTCLSYTDGMTFMYRPTVACTGAMAINVDGRGAKTAKMGGDDTVAGSVNIADTLLCVYRLSTDTIEIINFTQEALPRTATKSATFTAAITDRNKTLLCNATSGAITANLLAAATAGNGFMLTIKKTDSSANTVTIDPNASETVDGAATFALSVQYQSVTIISDGANWNVLATAFSGAAHGQCRLAKNGSNITLSPFNGKSIIINGASFSIPSAGVSLAPSGLTVGTFYYIYVYNNAGTLTLEASTTGHSTDATTGVEIKTGDGTRTLVGMVRPITGPAFADTGNQRFVSSYFNRRSVPLFKSATGATISSASAAELNSADRLEFLTWVDEGVQVGHTYAGSSGASTVLRTQMILDGSGLANSYTNSACPASEATGSSYINLDYIAEGYHYVGVQAWRGAANVTFIQGSITGVVRG